jgi:two-component system OmpR family sensor kinase
VASRASSIRSAAQGTSSAPRTRAPRPRWWRSLPIRWRLAGGSALLTLVILLAFAALVGVLTTQQIRSDFESQVRVSADDLSSQISLEIDRDPGRLTYSGPDLDVFASSAEGSAIRLVTLDGEVIRQTTGAPDLGEPTQGSTDHDGYLVEGRPLEVSPGAGIVWLQYARPLSTVRKTATKVWLFLALGVIGATALALLAGLAVARRAMAPIQQLTAAANEVERTRDASRKLPVPPAEDEVAELARTLDGMLHALDESRSETEAALNRQREFVADASHELRTPLTSVLSNLELLADELEGEQAETAHSALRASKRMRRLVSDLLLLARADAGRQAKHLPTDLGEAAAEVEPIAGEHELHVEANPAVVMGSPDDLHRLVLNLLANSVRHTPPGTSVHASVRRESGTVTLVVEDDGPGIPEELGDRVFERFVRADGDSAGKGTGLGLAIVRAVTERHGGKVVLGRSAEGGARFTITLPEAENAGNGSGAEPHPAATTAPSRA